MIMIFLISYLPIFRKWKAVDSPSCCLPHAILLYLIHLSSWPVLVFWSFCTFAASSIFSSLFWSLNPLGKALISIQQLSIAELDLTPGHVKSSIRS
jgi:hypothetical protein